jgi:hypothetical protein
MKNSKVLSSWADEWEKLDNEKFAAEMAVQNAKFAKGVVSLNKVINENINTLAEWNEESLNTWEVVAQVQEALLEALGIEVSAEFIKANLKEIQALA